MLSALAPLSVCQQSRSICPVHSLYTITASAVNNSTGGYGRQYIVYEYIWHLFLAEENTEFTYSVASAQDAPENDV